MGLLALLETRARRLADAQGHQVGAFRPGQQGTQYVAVCARCGALAIVSVHPRHGGIRGTACGKSCSTRQVIRPVGAEWL